MKRNWLYVLLAVSLAGNAVGLGLLGYRKWRERHDMDTFNAQLQSNASIGHLVPMTESFRPLVDSLDIEVLKARREIARAEAAGDTDLASVEPWIARQAELERAVHAAIFQSRIALNTSPDSSHRRGLEKRWRAVTGVSDK